MPISDPVRREDMTMSTPNATPVRDTVDRPKQVIFDASKNNIVIHPESRWVLEQLHGQKISAGCTEDKEGVGVPIQHAHEAKRFLESKGTHCVSTDEARELMDAWRKASTDQSPCSSSPA